MAKNILLQNKCMYSTMKLESVCIIQQTMTTGSDSETDDGGLSVLANQGDLHHTWKYSATKSSNNQHTIAT